MRDCVDWPGSHTAAGYGRIGHIYAHRFIWGLVNGPIPSGQHVLHHCDNPPCVNPQHLFLGTKGRADAKVLRGEFNGSSKLTAVDVRTILQRVRIGKAGGRGEYRGNAQELAKEFRVSCALIYSLAKGKGWKHIPRS